MVPTQVPLETLAVLPTEMFPVINGKTLLVGAAIAGEALNIEIERIELEINFRDFNLKKLFIAKSFHRRLDLILNATRYMAISYLFHKNLGGEFPIDHTSNTLKPS
jgi:hypothetical protein